MEYTANFAASFVKGHLEGVHKTSLVTICEPSLSPVSEDGKDNSNDNTLPRNKRKSTNGVTQYAKSSERTLGTRRKCVHMNTPMKGGSEENSQITDLRGRF